MFGQFLCSQASRLEHKIIGRWSHSSLSQQFHNHLLCLLPQPVLHPLTVFSKSKSSSSFTSKHGQYVLSKTEIVKYARKNKTRKTLDVRGRMALDNVTSRFSTMLEPIASAR